MKVNIMSKEANIKSTKDTCDTFCFDEEKVNRIQPQIEKVNGVELIFKALSDATRLKIAYALTLEKELCVCDVANIIDATTATASHHLRLLRNMKLAKYRKEGKLVFYSLADDHVRQLVYIAMIHGKEDEPNGGK
ncbi:ArsR/SmtB family transcription factor [Virgibacillus flavescens]|uniref:ArsR/SmtB family transcription factor n=1 Tax=Virgibacillus flavescens TaxID=1611422 RepID=UPI003D33B7AA